ncbi:MAG: flagellar hook capping FlgD N-terminal domain-containing protein [Zymomonas mobilis subsp. pomaceae]|uniref:Basal-body rod modification protein FlgD n=2 Tax=Zymomonas mobilis TaxID=542 RepID=F8ERQ3_ZYMMT|nr:flagellar hook capping protein [Zymomonas mobilis subsp. pomaceae ATCC 29192]GEB88686.1 basal-body rod modification protein FlgD [Zymomonas mobilis subsp. pomaceae]
MSTTSSVSGQSYINQLSTGSSSSATTTSSSSDPTAALSSTDFLKLLTTQLQYQDPDSPVDDTQMAAQMAQFSSVAGINQMNTTLSSIQSDVSNSRLSNASDWIGKAALVSSNTVTSVDGIFAGQVALDSSAADVKISLADSTGKVVYSQDYGSQSAGNVSFSFSGTDSNGDTVSGPLSVKVNATNSSGGSVSSSTSTWTMVNAVNSPASGTTQIVTSLGTYDPSDITSIS